MENFKSFYMENFANSCTSFKGRLTRREYVVANLLLGLTTIPFILLCMAILFLAKSMVLTIVAFLIITVAASVAHISINIRRLHDLGYSGVTILLMIIPVINLFFVVAMLCMRGNIGANNYGADRLPQDIGEDHSFDEKKTSLIIGLPAYVIKNIYGHMFFYKLLRSSGRASRREYFTKLVGSFMLYQLTSLILGVAAWFTSVPIQLYAISKFILFACVIFGVIVDIRRGYDRGQSWLNFLWFIVPILNLWHIAKQMSIPGENTTNQYGECSVEIDDNGIPMDDF